MDLLKIRGKIQKIEKSQFGVRIERNDPPVKRRPGSQKFKTFYLTIQGELPALATPDQFWEFICIRKGDYLRLKEGLLITEEIVENWDKDFPEKRPTRKSKLEKITVIESPTIMISGKQPEITVKFTERPELPEQGKKVTLQVTGENGIVIKGELNRKTLAKQVQKIDNFEDWIGAFSGTISEITSEGVVILERGSVQIFERKKKVKSSDSETKEVSLSN